MSGDTIERASRPFRRVYDDSGELVEVIIDYRDFRLLLQKLAAETDWEVLPPHLQDLVDTLLIEEAEAETGEDRPLRDLLDETEYKERSHA